MTKFDKLVEDLLESNVAGGTGSVLSNGSQNIGQYGNALYTGDTYATGNMQIPTILGAKKSKKKGSKKIRIPIQRRTFTYF